jgi:hypothetical protein
MFTDLIEYPIESEKLRWEARHVLRDFNDEPHLLLRLTLTGTRFPQRAQMPFVVVDNEVNAYYTEIAEDEMSVRAYFGRPLPEGGKIEFGYGPAVLLRFPKSFTSETVEWLDVKRLPEGTCHITAFYGGDLLT